MCNIPEDVRKALGDMLMLYENGWDHWPKVHRDLSIIHSWLDSLPAAPEKTGLSFWGWWSEDDKEDEPKPYEHFCVFLFGEESGDIAEEPERVAEVLACSGYELVLRKRQK